MTRPNRDPVPPAAHAVLDLFRSDLGDVRFPDVDRATLDRAEEELLEAQHALEAAEAALDHARAVVAERTSALSAKAQRALAYARVFAEEDAALRERIEAMASPGRREKQVADPAAAPKRTRKKKDADGATLFEEPAAASELQVSELQGSELQAPELQ